MPVKEYIKDAGALIKVYTNELEEAARQQLRNCASLPFVHPFIAAMPDVHAGYGATVGSVIPTRGAIIPSAVGVDIGCGMMAVNTGITLHKIPKGLDKLRAAIEAAIPHGRTDNGGKNDKGAWSEVPDDVLTAFKDELAEWLEDIEDSNPDIINTNTNIERHLGTLGTGNHFIEICLDEKDTLWLVLHSGSRGVGNRIGTYFIQRAKQQMAKWYISLVDKDLAYLPAGDDLFYDYIDAVQWAQRYAKLNRKLMMNRVKECVANWLELSELPVVEEIDCHHNYTAQESHNKSNVWVTRKGAIRARTGDRGIIPGSMGAKSYIVTGLGCEDSLCSASHGAGRKMSRTMARATFTEEDLKKQTEGIECKKDESVLDEIPSAYKDIDVVMENQKDLVTVTHTLRQIVNIKG